jgi:hypothetical protein
MKVNVIFKKLTTVDYEDTRLNEVVGKSFNHGEVIKDVVLEENVNGYVNLHFDNGDLAIGVPKNTFDVLA